MICASVNLLFFIRISSFTIPRKSYFQIPSKIGGITTALAVRNQNAKWIFLNHIEQYFWQGFTEVGRNVHEISVRLGNVELALAIGKLDY